MVERKRGKYGNRVPLKEQLMKKLANVLSPEELTLIPTGYQIIGDIMLLNLKSPLLKYQDVIANAILEILPPIKTVYLHTGGIKGQFREPNQVRYIAGEKKSITRHLENHVVFEFDIEKIMFAKGNINERQYLPKLVQPGEIIVDMFAGIGYFSVPIAVHARPSRIYSIEINPTSFGFLQKNIALNKVESIISPFFGNCRDIASQLAKGGIIADRIIMGILPAPKEYLPTALLLTSPGKNTILHYEGVVVRKDIDPLFQDVREASKQAGRIAALREWRIVKNYGPFKYHAVIDCEIL
jgi:tRNA wybutosine-synthesizing protein 2